MMVWLNGVLEGGYKGSFFVCLQTRFFTPVYWLLCLKACSNVAGTVIESGEN